MKNSQRLIILRASAILRKFTSLSYQNISQMMKIFNIKINTPPPRDEIELSEKNVCLPSAHAASLNTRDEQTRFYY